MILMFISKKEASDLIRYNYKPKIKKSQIEKIVGQEWEHKKLTKKQIKDLGLGFLLDVFGSHTYYCLYQISRSRQFSRYCLGCFDANNKMMFYNRIYFSSEKKFRKVLSLKGDEGLLDFYNFDASKLSLVDMDYFRVFEDTYYFKIFKYPYSPSNQFSIEIFDSSRFLGQFDFNANFDEISTLVELNKEDIQNKIFDGLVPLSNEKLHFVGAEHLLLIQEDGIEYFLAQNFK